MNLVELIYECTRLASSPLSNFPTFRKVQNQENKLIYFD